MSGCIHHYCPICKLKQPHEFTSEGGDVAVRCRVCRNQAYRDNDTVGLKEELDQPRSAGREI